MRPNRRQFLGAVTGSIALAGCTDSEGGPDATATDTPTDQSMDGDGNDGGGGGGNDAIAVGVREHSEHGRILVDGQGMTLYMFDPDTRGEGASECYDDCANAWPPLTVDDDPTGGDGVTADLTTFERDDGEMQVAAAGWPLYYFASDEEAGDAKGQGINDVWWVLTPDGTPVKPEATSTDTMTSDGTY